MPKKAAQIRVTLGQVAHSVAVRTAGLQARGRADSLGGDAGLTPALAWGETSSGLAGRPAADREPPAFRVRGLPVSRPQ